MVTFLILTHWHWWGVAALLIVGELLAPCLYFMAWSLAAAIVGLVVRFLPGMPGLWQIGLFILMSIILLSTAYVIRSKRAAAEQQKTMANHSGPKP